MFAFVRYVLTEMPVGFAAEPSSNVPIHRLPMPLGDAPTMEPPSLAALPSSSRYQIRQGDGSPLNFELELEQYCACRNIPPPEYSAIETFLKGRFMVIVKVGNVEYGGGKNFESIDVARENATLVALASIGLDTLKREAEGKIFC